MNIIFRADASYAMGAGHVMRCLTLAVLLKERGANCEFICKNIQGNLITKIQELFIKVHVFESKQSSEAANTPALIEDYRSQMSTDWIHDANFLIEIAKGRRIGWVVVDCYFLDSKWEREVTSIGAKLLVLDDLADRHHYCDLLVDQNPGRKAPDYDRIVNSECVIAVGPEYAILREEFSRFREQSLRRRKGKFISDVLITVGGYDHRNLIERILRTLNSFGWLSLYRITVILGFDNSSEARIRELINNCSRRDHRVIGSTKNMAKLLAESDLVIGAAGTSALERCCLGVPSVNIAVALNQISGGRSLQHSGAALLVESFEDLEVELAECLRSMSDTTKILEMQIACKAITDGRGAERIAEKMIYAPL